MIHTPEKKLQRNIDLAVGNLRLIRHDLKGLNSDFILDQVNKRLVFISPSKEFLYEMTYHDSYYRYRLTKPDQVIWAGYVLKIERVTSRITEPELFLEILKHTRKKINIRNHRAFINSKLVLKDVPRSKCIALFQEIKRARADFEHPDHRKYKNIQHFRIEDRLGKNTIYPFREK
jgi:hypothetical protein